MPQKVIAAAIQMTTTPVSLDENVATVRRLIAQAKTNHNVSLIVLPEYWATLGMKQVHTFAETLIPDSSAVSDSNGLQSPPSEAAEPLHSRIQTEMSAIALEFGITLVGGTIPTRSLVSGKYYNSCLVYNPLGERIASYNKIHLFKFEGPPAFDEGQTVVGGEVEPVTVAVSQDKEWNCRLSVCYDMRFPELYRQESGSYNMIVVPAAFTVETGRAHWEVLLRARAIESQSYLIASAQVGTHPVTGRITYGHSMIIDPWGRVVAEESGDTESVVVWEMDLDVVKDVRHRLPALTHHRL
ncbi:UNVERIFIED_CONTAM: hypothetical protein HDU68_012889 [Siphonaria sp. JEL0065]|nr:hypothetical protein HDU68_012889 [Siphonaria sp. JEL0065]